MNTDMTNGSFFSIDRLVEFGMSLAVAQQMIKTMNHAINNMQIPGSGSVSGNPMQPVLQQIYYVIIEGKQAGPFSESELSHLIAEKKITKESHIWKPGLVKWEVAEKIPEVLKLVALLPPPFQP
jgi:hypothetical protein